jgi:hypothetical protein
MSVGHDERPGRERLRGERHRGHSRQRESERRRFQADLHARDQIIIRCVVHFPRSWWIITVLLVPAVCRAAAVDRLSRTVHFGSFEMIRPVVIDATVADVTITGSDGPDLVIDIVRRAPSSEALETYPAIVDEGGEVVRISAVQRDDGRDPNLKTEITISAPAGAVFQSIRVFEGRVKLRNLKGACDLDLRRGAIEAVGLGGRVRLEAGIGSLDLREPDLTPGGMMRLRVFNGPVRVRFAHPPANGRILAVTLNGTITSDVPLTMKDRFGPRFGETTIGSGEPVMSIDVVKGDISITVAAKGPI